MTDFAHFFRPESERPGGNPANQPATPAEIPPAKKKTSEWGGLRFQAPPPGELSTSPRLAARS